MNTFYEILSKLANKDKVLVEEEIEVDVHLALAHDKSMPSIMELAKGENEIKYWDKLYVTVDHFLPAPNSDERDTFLKIKKFCVKNNIVVYSNGEGIMHQVVCEKFGDELENKVVVGVDGHVLTSGGLGAIPFSIKANEMIEVLKTSKYRLTVPESIKIQINEDFIDELDISGKDIALYIIKEVGKNQLEEKSVILTGDYLNNISQSQKMTIGNMLGEIGAKTCYFNNKIDENEKYHNEYIFHSKNIKHMIALPGSTENVANVEEVVGEKITQVFIGGCTNGRIDDMEVIANILKDKLVNNDVTLIVCPASRNVANEMDLLGYSKIIRDSGGIIINPGCGACAGVHQGVISSEDVIITTTPRNTAGRMGDNSGKIYLASPKIAAISAIKGYIASNLDSDLEKVLVY